MSHKLFVKPYTHPRYWPDWLGIGSLRLITSLPHPLRLAVGRMIGRLAYAGGKSRRHVTEVNIRHCFPELDEAAQQAIVKKHFLSLGMALVETGIAWWEDKATLQKLVDVEGLEYIRQWTDQGRGVILLSAHFTSLELGNRLMSDALDEGLDAMYQAHKHAFKEHVISHYRNIHMANMITETDIRQLIRSLKQGRVVWYASDQGYNDKHYIMAPFFGVDATCNTALSRLAKVSGAAIVPFFVQRQDNGRYLLRLQPSVGIPSGDEKQDVVIYHQLIEEHTRRAPEQYLWSHRRFKKRPPPYPDLYAK